MNNHGNLTNITNIKPADVIRFTWPHKSRDITVKSVEAHGENETLITDIDGNQHLFSNNNWFEVN